MHVPPGTRHPVAPPGTRHPGTRYLERATRHATQTQMRRPARAGTRYLERATRHAPPGTMFYANVNLMQ